MCAFSVAWAIVVRYASMPHTSEAVVERMFPFAFTGDARRGGEYDRSDQEKPLPRGRYGRGTVVSSDRRNS